MKYKTILYTVNDGWAAITLNRPDVLNAIVGRMLEEIQDAIKHIENDKKIRVVVINSSSKKAFSSGIDVAYVKDMKALDARGVGKALHKTFSAVRLLEKPVIASISGLCLGAGLELAISCDILIASKDSKFGLPNIHRGIPAIVEAAILPQAIGIFGTKEMCFTGEFWDADKAERRGLLNAVVEPGKLKPETKKWVDKLKAKSPVALATQKDIINKWMTTDLETAIDFSINTVCLNWMTRDQKEGMESFIQKRKAEFKGE